MENIIVPNWHPFLVHFTVATTIVSTVFFLLSKFVAKKSEEFRIVAKWSLVTAAAFTVLTVIAGFSAFNSVAHDDIAHAVMKTHRNWALAAFAALILGAFFAYRSRATTTAILIGSIFVTTLVGTAAYYGAELVYRHGLGVMRLPDSLGEGHSHQGGGDHSHETTEKTTERTSSDHDHGTHDHGDTISEIDPGQISDAFLAALKTGDVNSVSELLAEDVLIIEGGHAQASKSDYMNGHMKSDMKFVPNMKYETISRETGQAGERAWVVTFSRSTGIYNGKEYDRTGREFMLLQKQGGHWKIKLIDWADR